MMTDPIRSQLTSVLSGDKIRMLLSSWFEKDHTILIPYIRYLALSVVLSSCTDHYRLGAVWDLTLGAWPYI